MAKAWGFCLSALLVGLCVCLNVRSYPNVFSEIVASQGAIQTDERATEQENPAPSESSELNGAHEGEKGDSENNNGAEEPAEETTFAANPGAESDVGVAKELDQIALERAAFRESHRIKNAASSSALEPTESCKPQGGKYVSIPSIEMDAISAQDASNARVVGAPVAPDEIPQRGM